jgi:hypothetical protein
MTNESTEQRVRIVIEVVAGLVPNKPIPDLTRRFTISSDAWYKQGEFESDPESAEIEVMKAYGFAQEYMRTLWNPSKVNWVQCNWIYF